MGTFLLVYDSNDSDLVRMGTRRAGELNATALGVDSVTQLKNEMLRLKRAGGVAIDRLLFYTHGDPGGIKFGMNYLTARAINSDFVGQGFESLFLPGAHVFFDGCNVADVKRGCSIPESCSETDNGPVFLKTFAKTFLFLGGGRVAGSTSAGFGFPLWGTKIYHLTGDVIYAIIKSGSTRVRMAIGMELSTPASSVWEVWDGKEYFDYTFMDDGRVFWCTKDEFRTLSWSTHQMVTLIDEDRRGKWSLDGDVLQIKWVGETEAWDRPLFSEYETGIAVNGSFPIPGRPGPDGTADIWAKREMGNYGWATPPQVYLFAK